MQQIFWSGIFPSEKAKDSTAATNRYLTRFMFSLHELRALDFGQNFQYCYEDSLLVERDMSKKNLFANCLHGKNLSCVVTALAQ